MTHPDNLTGADSPTDSGEWGAFPPPSEFLRPTSRRSILELEMIALSAQLRATIWTIRLTRLLMALAVLGVAFLGCEIAAAFWRTGPLWWWTR